MTEGTPEITLGAVHEDLTAGFADFKAEMRAGFADVKAALIAGFSSLPSHESSEEMLRLLRERNKILAAQIDAMIRARNNGDRTV
jgi:hypothetical protein